jgi:(R)-2-hydroxyacyl-CoA dehydratese activating ATPase
MFVGYYCGIDIGASAAKLVIIDGDGQVAARALRRSGVDYAQTARQCLNDALELAGLAESEIAGILSTGYGRDNVPFAGGKMTEIACHGKGAFHAFPRAMTVIDIGAQDCKVIHLDGQGRREGFKMNRKCAAGTGAFLEEIAFRLDLAPERLNGLAERSTSEVSLGSFCTVFAATEILERIRAGVKVEDIVKGAFRSVVKRLLEMDTIDGALVLTGGVAAHNPILVKLVEESFGRPVLVPPEAQFVGAFGAALFAAEAAEHKGL